MKKTILFLCLLFPSLSWAYPIYITNSGHSKNLIILPVSPMPNGTVYNSLQINTMTSCLEASEGLSVVGEFVTIPPQTTVTYEFDIPSNFMNVCPYIYHITANSMDNGTLTVFNTYNVGLTKTQAIQRPAFTFNISYYYSPNLTPAASVGLSPFSQPAPRYVTYDEQYLGMTVNADEMPGTQ